MNCPNPKCGYSEEDYAKQFGEKYAEEYPLFAMKFPYLEKSKFWLRCTMCDTEFRPTKTLNGLKVLR